MKLATKNMNGKSKSGTVIWSLVALLLIGLGYWSGMQRSVHVVQRNATAQAERKPLFYRNPMGLPDTSPVPKKDAMGMDYIPVFAGDESVAGSSQHVTISVEKIQKLGVKNIVVGKQVFIQTVRAVGRVEPNERSIHIIAPKFEGWVEQLHVNTTGAEVHVGQALFEAYSPELLSAQREYQIAVRGAAAMKNASPEALANMNNLVNSSLARLKNWDVAPEALRPQSESGVPQSDVNKSGEEKRTITFRSPVRGIVLDKLALKGMRFMPGETLFKIADLSKLWVIADVFEQDIALLKIGQAAQVSIDAFPGKELTTHISYIYPTINEQTRTAQVRLELNNADGQLRPGMFTQVTLVIKNNQQAVLVVPDSAVIHSGQRELVLVDSGAGKFEPRVVKLGRQSDDQIEILEGVTEGEKVVVSANFLIDAESNLKAAIAGFGEQSAPTASKNAQPVQTHRGVGILDATDAGKVTITHSAIAALGWPVMSMNFNLTHAGLIKDIKLGEEIDFEFIERQPGVWEVTKIIKVAQPVSPRKGH